MPEIIAIDPGETHSAYVVWDGINVLEHGDIPNEEMRSMLRSSKHKTLVIEWLSGFGIPSGNSTFETCRWVGKFEECFSGKVQLLTRKKVKEHLQAVNDKFVRQALIARFGEPGTKKAPGTLYGVTGHRLAALAVAVTYCDLNLS
jgi:hypothetical protein